MTVIYGPISTVNSLKMLFHLYSFSLIVPFSVFLSVSLSVSLPVPALGGRAVGPCGPGKHGPAERESPDRAPSRRGEAAH